MCPIFYYLGYDHLSFDYAHCLIVHSTLKEPSSYLEAIITLGRSYLYLQKHIIGCRWVYKIKYQANGEVERFKAKLVAKRYSQQEDLDYEKTFTPVAKMVTVKVVILVNF